MSTIVVVKKAGYAAIAADSLSKWGSTKESAVYVCNHAKILSIGENYVAFSAPTSVKTIAEDYFLTLSGKVDLSSLKAIFRTWLSFHKALKEKYFLTGIEDRDANVAFESSQMDVLIANPHGIFGVDAHRAVQEFSKFYAYGGGWRFGLGAMRAVYDDPRYSAEDIAKIGIEVAAEFDDETGLPLVVHKIALRERGGKTKGPRRAVS